MPIDVDYLILLFCHLSEQNAMAADVKRRHLLAGAGAGAFIESLLAGPPGVIIGAVLHDCFCGETGQLKPVSQILLELPPHKKKKLCDEAMVILCPFDWSGLSELIALVMENASLQQKLIALLTDYFSKELGADIKPSE
ncbi:C19orf12-like protein [Columba livia]|uniref:Protein C19orf12 homolog n=1 Tax=Columba livia TaxID=8932 RepID=A0A2I0M7U3_COLLI|nr:protein C19orf12 homolog isoform X1 [Columba livia]KAK2545804.1 C19orf12-like protein [Columba livia]PKK25748.1 protein C19orf12 homolog [Columba livia]